MSEEVIVAEKSGLEAHYPELLTRDERKGYEGFLVKPENLVELVTRLKNEAGYDYLSSVTGVDYFPDDIMEVVYHLYQTTGGEGLNIKVQLPRENPVVSTLTSIFPGADFQEREIWDLMGIHFEGHPNMKRIMLWEGFEGHPLRKDFL